VERMQGWVGRKDRPLVKADAVVHRADGSHVPVKVTNISDEGCRIESIEHFGIGEHITIAIPRMGTVKAQIRWSLPDSAGAKFLSAEAE
jgi:PilZ domain